MRQIWPLPETLNHPARESNFAQKQIRAHFHKPPTRKEIKESLGRNISGPHGTQNTTQSDRAMQVYRMKTRLRLLRQWMIKGKKQQAENDADIIFDVSHPSCAQKDHSSLLLLDCLITDLC